MRRTTWPLLLIGCGMIGCALTAGCGPPTATVSGQVLVDDTPLKSGVISFVPAEGEGTPATATIENGRYSIKTTPGKKRVQISAPVVVGKHKEYDAPDAPLLEITEESLPEKYNVSSELNFDVQPGENDKDWSVDSKAKER